MCRRRASGRGCGGRIRGRTFRTEGRVASVVAVVRDARRRVRRVRRSDTARRDATRRWEDAAEENAGEENRRRTGETARPGTTRSRRSERNRRVSPAFWVNGVPLRDSFSFSRSCVAPRKAQAENPKLLRERAPLRGDQRARALLIRTMVSPDATDDPESAEKQPQVRVLSDRRVPLDQCGRVVSAFLVTTSRARCRRERLPAR